MTRLLAEMVFAALFASPALLFGYWQMALVAVAFFVPLHFAWSAWSVTKDMYYQAKEIVESDPSDKVRSVRTSIQHFVEIAPLDYDTGTNYRDRLDAWFGGADQYLQNVVVFRIAGPFHQLRNNGYRNAALGVGVLRSIADQLTPQDLR